MPPTTDKTERAKTQALGKVSTSAKKLDDLLARADTARDELDQRVLAARETGAKYREIADASNRSTAWVQTAMERTGYRPAPRGGKG